MDRQIEAGIHFLVPLGTTGETPCLSVEERVEVLKIAKAHAGGRPLVVGGGTNSLSGTVASMKALERYGVDAFLIVVPYYNKPTQDGLYAYLNPGSPARPRGCKASYGLVVFRQNSVSLEIRALEGDGLLAQETIAVDNASERHD